MKRRVSRFGCNFIWENMLSNYSFFPICFLGFLMTSYSSFVNKNENEEQQISETKQDSFYFPISIPCFSSSQAPCVDVLIDHRMFSMRLDLGMKGDLSIANELLDQIPNKVFARNEYKYGFKGKKYPITVYRIPKLKIGVMSFFQAALENDCAELRKDAVIIPSEKSSLSGKAGKLGWELFYNSNILIDTPNSQIAFCDSVNTLKEHGYPTEDFVKVPLLIERGLVEFVADTPNGPLRCALDTGSTINILNTEIEEGKSLEQAFLDDENRIEYSSFHLEQRDLGPISFHRLPINIPIKIEAVLGMEFFQDHLVFINFSERQIYFLKNSPH